MKERALNRKRTLVGVDMGEGYRDHNDPVEAVDFLVRRCDELCDRLVTATLRMSSRTRVTNFASRGFLSADRNREFTDALEEFRTAQLEVAWMFGKQDVVDQILGVNNVKNT